mgnify:CR=1 FL=1
MTTRPGFSFCICPDGKLLRQQVEELLGAHPDAGRERHVFWGDDELPPKFWEILTLQGLFSTSRVLVMRNAHALTADVWKRLSAALSRPNPQTWPLFCLEVAWEKGQPKIPAHIAKLPCFTFADAKGWIWRSPGLEPRSLRRHIQIRSKALGLDLEPGCVDILAETLLPDAAAVDAELSKLQLLAGGKPLTQEQARSVSPTTEFNVFAFLRQLQAGQTASVWKSILEEQAKGEEPLFYLLAMLQREARQLWQILAGEQVRMGPSDQQAKQQTASRLGAAGLAKAHDLTAHSRKGVGQKADMGGLAGAVAALERDEHAALGRLLCGKPLIGGFRGSSRVHRGARSRTALAHHRHLAHDARVADIGHVAIPARRRPRRQPRLPRRAGRTARA